MSPSALLAIVISRPSSTHATPRAMTKRVWNRDQPKRSSLAGIRLRIDPSGRSSPLDRPNCSVVTVATSPPLESELKLSYPRMHPVMHLRSRSRRRDLWRWMPLVRYEMRPAVSRPLETGNGVRQGRLAFAGTSRPVAFPLTSDVCPALSRRIPTSTVPRWRNSYGPVITPSSARFALTAASRCRPSRLVSPPTGPY